MAEEDIKTDGQPTDSGTASTTLVQADGSATEDASVTPPTQAEPENAATETSTEETVETVKTEEAIQKIVPGMVIRVHIKIKETTPRGDERERIQVFEGTVIAKKGRDRVSATITVRKISNGIGVERIFPLAMPAIDRIEVVKQLRVRRSKLYFLRGIFRKRLKEVPVQKA